MFSKLIHSIESLTHFDFDFRRHKFSVALFFALCFNLLLAPLVYAATTSELTRSQAWALGLLGLSTAALSIYLFFVMFAPEKF